MAGFVVDASVLEEYLVSGPRAQASRDFLQKLTDDAAVTVTDFCLTECTNAIWKQHRFHGMTEAMAMQLFDILREMDLRIVPADPYLGESLAIGMRNRLAIYDACYIALAADFGYTLVSLDRGQLRAASAEGLSLVNIAT